MSLIRGALIGLLLLGAAHDAAAQQAEAVNVNRLPIDLHRLQRDLRESSATQTDNHGLKINYRVDVYGAAPRLEIVTKSDNLSTPAPYGGPTHQEMMNAVVRTPDGRGGSYRPPEMMDVSSFLRWLADRTSKK